MLRTDEVQSLTARTTQVGGNEVDLALLATDGAVQAARPDLGVCGQLIGDATNIEKQRLKVGELLLSDGEKTSGPRVKQKDQNERSDQCQGVRTCPTHHLLPFDMPGRRR